MQLPEGSLQEHPRPWPQRREPPDAVPVALRGDPQPVRGGRRRQRVRVAAGPPRAVEEPPGEEVTRRCPEPGQGTAAHHHADGVRAFGDDGLDHEPVAQRPGQRHGHPPDKQGGGGRGPQRPPVHRGHGIAQEVLAGPELVRQGEADAEVGVQVQQVPGLVPEGTPRGPHGRDHDRGQRGGAGDREQHAGVVEGEVDELTDHAVTVAGRVAEGDEHDVREHQVEGPEADEPVPAGELVLPEGPLHERDPGHQQHLDEQEVGGDQSGQPAGGVEAALTQRVGQVLQPAAGHPEGDHDEHAEPGQDARRVAPPAGHEQRAAERTLHAGRSSDRRPARHAIHGTPVPSENPG